MNMLDLSTNAKHFADKLDLSIIIVNYNTGGLTIDCIKSISKFTKGIDFEIVLVDNGSTDDSISSFKSLKLNNLKLIESKKNLGFGGGNNLGLKHATGRYILYLNSDTLLLENSLEKMTNWMDKNPQAGGATCKITFNDNSPQANGGSTPNLFRVFLWATFLDDLPLIYNLFGSYHPNPSAKFLSNSKKPVQQDWIIGAFLLVRREVIEKVGGFDDSIFMYGEDVEYSYRIRKAGFSLWYFPDTKIIHYGSASTNSEVVNFSGKSTGKKNAILGEFEGLKAFYKKHYSKLSYMNLLICLRLAAIFRIIMFGIIKRQPQAVKIYAEAYKTI
jgi:GT2 family glycosyltransferase